MATFDIVVQPPDPEHQPLRVRVSNADGQGDALAAVREVYPECAALRVEAAALGSPEPDVRVDAAAAGVQTVGAFTGDGAEEQVIFDPSVARCADAFERIAAALESIALTLSRRTAPDAARP